MVADWINRIYCIFSEKDTHQLSHIGNTLLCIEIKGVILRLGGRICHMSTTRHDFELNIGVCLGEISDSAFITFCPQTLNLF